ncbi:hypothetical protein H2201_007082, partial [Coniosporium apollinis]
RNNLRKSAYASSAMESSLTSPRYRVGVLLFEGVDILDFAGPIEILSHVSTNQNPDNPDRVFEIRTIARSATVRAANSLTVAVDVLLDEARQELETYDILVVPGGPPAVMIPLSTAKGPELELIKGFAALRAKSEKDPRVLLSVCTGAFPVAATGLFGGLTVTTHHRALDVLSEICAKANVDGQKTEVVHKRFVDGGVIRDGVRIVTAGGISSGLDAALYLVSQKTSHDMAAFISRVMEYGWRKE